jgi:hypothetical protein
MVRICGYSGRGCGVVLLLLPFCDSPPIRSTFVHPLYSDTVDIAPASDQGIHLFGLHCWDTVLTLAGGKLVMEHFSMLVHMEGTLLRCVRIYGFER